MSKVVGLLAVAGACVVGLGCGQAESLGELSAAEAIGGHGGGGSSGTPGPLYCGLQGGNGGMHPIFYATADAQIEQAVPTTNAGNLALCQAKGGSNQRRCLLRFDLTSVPPSTQVLEACLTLQILDPSTSNYYASQLLRGWSESAATWEKRDSASSWQVPGAWGALDSGPTAVATIPKNNIALTHVSVTPSLVQSWVTTPGSNYGILIANSASNDGIAFATRESAGVGVPMLQLRTAP